MLAGLIGGLLTPLVVGVLSIWIRNSQPYETDGENGRISPEKGSAALTVLFFGSIFVICIAVLVHFMIVGGVNSSIISIIVLFMAISGVFGGFMAPSLTHMHDVRWDAEGVEGTSELFGLTLGFKTCRIQWNEIASRGKTFSGYDFIQSGDGQRVYWSYLYSGNGEFERVLAAKAALS